MHTLLQSVGSMISRENRSFQPFEDDDMDFPDESFHNESERPPVSSLNVNGTMHKMQNIERKKQMGKVELHSDMDLPRRIRRSDKYMFLFCFIGLTSLLAAVGLALKKWGMDEDKKQYASLDSQKKDPATAGPPFRETEAPVPLSWDFLPSADADNDNLAMPDLTDPPTLQPMEALPQWVTEPIPSNPPKTDSPTDAPLPFPTGSPTMKPVLPPPSAPPSRRPSKAPTKRPTDEPTAAPVTSNPTVTIHDLIVPSYIPGNLTTRKEGLLLSEGLDARMIAIAGQNVPYAQGGWSKEVFHDQPDAGATFPDTRPENPGGWIYMSNSEVDLRAGGVGAITFDKNGRVSDYRMMLENTNMNCGGGRTPWNTWISCEEVEFTGLIYQVHPEGAREPQVITLGNDGGRWESFAYDIRDVDVPHFFATEDHSKGTVRRFTPQNPNWDDPWNILHGNGTTDYLMLFPNEAMDGGTYIWTDDLRAAKDNARMYYPMTEGIDVYENEMFFVCKRIRMLFVLDLDSNTYYNETTRNGLFDGTPDQISRIVRDTRGLAYFTEEGGNSAGVHARDHLGRYYTVFENPSFPDETTGLSFSPDGRFMYTAYQNKGYLYEIWRKDGLPFQATYLDVKFHHQPS